MKINNHWLEKNREAKSPIPKLPQYDRSQLRTGIVHLGIGNFHRAHQAVYVDELLERDLSWGITGVSLKRPLTAKALNPQDGLYVLGVESDDDLSTKVIASVREILFIQDDWQTLLERCTHPDLKMISLTVTEKGYCFNTATGELLKDHPDIIADLGQGGIPTSVPGILAAILKARQEKNCGALTILSCDNLPDNGRIAEASVRQFAEILQTGLSDSLLENISFPSTMVDRIVPATTTKDKEKIASACGMQDAWPVITEPFSQWVIEDKFATQRPDFKGVEWVKDIAPFENMKLRMLNGAHSALAYLGQIGGLETVSDAMSHPVLGEFIRELWHEEIIPTLKVPGVDLPDYARSLEQRFLNTALHHRTAQIAMDGSQKIPQRFFGTLEYLRAARKPHRRLSTALAAWLVYSSGAQGRFTPSDPLAEKFAQIAEKTLPDFSAYLYALAELVPSLQTVVADQTWQDFVVHRTEELFICDGDIARVLPAPD